MYIFVENIQAFHKFKINRLCVSLFVVLSVSIQAQHVGGQPLNYPYSTDSTHITVWNGKEYAPLFIKGINLGVAVPGTFPGELAATAEDYRKWFALIREAGFNVIRLYTLHYPRFYEELRIFNLQNPNQPLLLMQGVWLEKEIAGYTEDLHELTNFFEREMRENIGAIHGDVIIKPRFGKAFGTYEHDVSEWNIAYVIGREIYPSEVLHTNDSHPGETDYNGDFLSVSESQATEVWLTRRMDYLLKYEFENYQTQRPISASSWPTLDPLSHPFETENYVVMASIDFQDIDYSNAQAGFFVTYHAYPYYPDYISRDPKYVVFSDHLGQNSYLGYLTYLKAHYPRFPLIIGEFGGSSGWGVARYAHNGIHHGGYAEREQGENNVRMFYNIDQAGGGGGMLFSWMDEWFKRTWITDPLDFIPGRRINWHNVTAAEQNFGLIGFRSDTPYGQETVYFTDSVDHGIRSLELSADYAYLSLKIKINEHIGPSDTIWVALDTYDEGLGETILPNVDTVDFGCEFALKITNFTATLFVTRSYDVFGLWHQVLDSHQVLQSTATTGAPWRAVRWKNGILAHEAQDIGNLRVNRLNMPQASNDGVRLSDTLIEVRIPWTLINVTDPTTAQVLHDDLNTPDRETRESDGMIARILYHGADVGNDNRFTWNYWGVPDAQQYLKASYDVMKKNLRKMPGDPIGRFDRYEVEHGSIFSVSVAEGLLSNDWSLDGSDMEVVVTQPPSNGILEINPDGSFAYYPANNFVGTDGFRYRILAGYNRSVPVDVQLDVVGEVTGDGFVSVFPNPATGEVQVRSKTVMDHIQVMTPGGKELVNRSIGSISDELDLSQYSPGIYFVVVYSAGQRMVVKVVKL